MRLRYHPAMAQPDILLDVSNLAYSYNGLAAVRDVSFQVGSGEIVALLGANGAGKSTTVKVVAGALRTRAGSLSGGEQQMLAIARGMMRGPRLMILDEPSLELAPLRVQELFRLIGAIAEEGVAVLLVEQNVHQSLKIAHRGYVMEKGATVLGGMGEELLDNDYVRRAFLGR